MSDPIDNIQWIDAADLTANAWNPNRVHKAELRLLEYSLLSTGWIQPVLANTDRLIIDGFHRYFTCLNNKDILERNCGMLPIVVLHKPINDRMASTVRHNRARGKHSIDGMSNMVFQMLENGWSEAEICAELGMEAEEVLRLKHITGFSKLFEDVQYKKAWESKIQLKLRKQAEQDATVNK